MKRQHKPKRFENNVSSNLSSTIYIGMIKSRAWNNLSKDARLLYVYMKLQYYGARPIKDHSELCFFFNKAMYIKDKEHPNSYRLYGNGKGFSKDMQELVNNGFLEKPEKYKAGKTIYMFSDKWQQV